jgi:hypothetical protein
MFISTMKTSDLKVIWGLLKICTAARAASRDFARSSLVTEKILRLRLFAAGMGFGAQV